MRLWPFGKRAIDIGDMAPRYEDRSEDMTTPEARRLFRRNVDMVAIYGAVYAAIRKRVAAISKPEMVLLRKVGKDFVEEPDDHKALQALYRVNEGLTFRQGFGLIEQHKLTSGDAFWIKRRNGLGVPVEFEIWPPHEVKVIADKEKPWLPTFFERFKRDGSTERVEMRDVVWFRHMVDPRNPLRGLSPIGAIRMELDTGMEARRFNQVFFDSAMMQGQMFTHEGGPAESARLKEEWKKEFKGTDRAHRTMILGGDLKPLEQRLPSHKDMEFLKQLEWGVEEVCRVFEIAPEILAVGNRTYENMPAAQKAFWETMTDQFSAMMDELNEFYIHPDFGSEFKLVGRYDNIPALQVDRKLQAELDEIYLRTAKVVVNELRERDGEDSVPWGDTPLVPNNIVPLGTAPAPSTAASFERAAGMERGWEVRLGKEARAISKHLTGRTIKVNDVDTYDWNWERRYGKEVAAELKVAFVAALEDTGFAGTPAAAQELAAKYARQRTITILAPSGKESITTVTRNWVRGLVSQTIEQGESLQTLQKHLREGWGFSDVRAETIARTETASAQTKGTLKSYESLGHEGKEWLTAGGACDICLTAEGDGPIRLGELFSNGFEGPPAHPNCKCSLNPVREMPRVIVRIGGDGQRP